METLQELVEQRRGYKYLTKDGKSPYQEYQYDMKSRKVMVTKLNTNLRDACGEGWNLATLKWIADNCLKLEGVIIECSIPKDAQIIVTTNSDGKFRTDKIKIKKVHSIESLFPIFKGLQKRVSNYKPVNPITAEVIPDVEKIKKIYASVWDSVWVSVGDSVWASVRDSVGDSVWDSVWDQSYICGYHAIKELFNLDYEHPSFEFVRMGIIVVEVKKTLKVYGKNGKHLGDVKL